MRLLDWKAEYCTGIEVLDHAHRGLIDDINHLHDAFDAEQCPRTNDFFLHLYAHVERHFADEEALLRAHPGAGFMQHKQDHEQLLEQIRDMADAFADAEEIDSVELSIRLNGWLARHFRTHDARSFRQPAG
jgi:hemerythrin